MRGRSDLGAVEVSTAMRSSTSMRSTSPAHGPSSSCGPDLTLPLPQLVARVAVLRRWRPAPVGRRVVVHDEVELACVETVDALEVVAGLGEAFGMRVVRPEEHPIGTDQLDQLSQVVLPERVK